MIQKEMIKHIIFCCGCVFVIIYLAYGQERRAYLEIDPTVRGDELFGEWNFSTGDVLQVGLGSNDLYVISVDNIELYFIENKYFVKSIQFNKMRDVCLVQVNRYADGGLGNIYDYMLAIDLSESTKSEIITVDRVMQFNELKKSNPKIYGISAIGNIDSFPLVELYFVMLEKIEPRSYVIREWQTWNVVSFENIMLGKLSDGDENGSIAGSREN